MKTVRLTSRRCAALVLALSVLEILAGIALWARPADAWHPLVDPPLILIIILTPVAMIYTLVTWGLIRGR